MQIEKKLLVKQIMLVKQTPKLCLYTESVTLSNDTESVLCHIMFLSTETENRVYYRINNVENSLKYNGCLWCFYNIKCLGF